jgi:hypothetical protein
MRHAARQLRSWLIFDVRHDEPLHMKSSVGLLLLALTFGGCATTGHFETIYGSWVGQPISDFVAAYGAPASVVQNGENLVYKYELKRLAPCKVYWTVDKTGMIVRWRHEGRGCVLAPFG